MYKTFTMTLQANYKLFGCSIILNQSSLRCVNYMAILSRNSNSIIQKLQILHPNLQLIDIKIVTARNITICEVLYSYTFLMPILKPIVDFPHYNTISLHVILIHGMLYEVSVFTYASVHR